MTLSLPYLPEVISWVPETASRLGSFRASPGPGCQFASALTQPGKCLGEEKFQVDSQPGMGKTREPLFLRRPEFGRLQRLTSEVRKAASLSGWDQGNGCSLSPRREGFLKEALLMWVLSFTNVWPFSQSAALKSRQEGNAGLRRMKARLGPGHL